LRGSAASGLFSSAALFFSSANRLSRVGSTSQSRACTIAALANRRAFSSGLSHAKCPKPGFRSNVFG
jgi:hypothetical protein